MYTCVDSFLNEHNLIYKLQFSFRKRYSTNHALLSIVEQIRTSLDSKKFACGVFVDLQKAFDTVDHKILLAKLSHYGIDSSANKWLSSYLTNRSQSVSLNGSTSDEKILPVEFRKDLFLDLFFSPSISMTCTKPLISVLSITLLMIPTYYTQTVIPKNSKELSTTNSSSLSNGSVLIASLSMLPKLSSWSFDHPVKLFLSA